MPETTRVTAAVRAYRKRMVAQGNKELTLHLPREAVAYLDELKKRHGLHNRSQALLEVIECGRAIIQ